MDDTLRGLRKRFTTQTWTFMEPNFKFKRMTVIYESEWWFHFFSPLFGGKSQFVLFFKGA